MFVLLNFMNIDNFIAEKNIDRYFNNPEDSNFDISYLCKLGTDATEQITRLLKADDEYIDFCLDANQIRNIVRGLNPSPLAKFIYNGNVFKVFETKAWSLEEFAKWYKNKEKGSKNTIS